MDVKDEPVEGASISVGKSSAARPPPSLGIAHDTHQHVGAPSSSSVVDSWMGLNRKSLPPTPRECGIMQDPFAFKLKKPRLSPPAFGMQSALAASVGGLPGSSGSAESPGPSLNFQSGVCGLPDGFRLMIMHDGRHCVR